MGLKVGQTIDRLALLARLLTVVLGTKDKTALNKIADGLEKAKVVKDAVVEPKRGDEGIVVLLVCFLILLFAPVFLAMPLG